MATCSRPLKIVGLLRFVRFDSPIVLRFLSWKIGGSFAGAIFGIAVHKSAAATVGLAVSGWIFGDIGWACTELIISLARGTLVEKLTQQREKWNHIFGCLITCRHKRTSFPMSAPTGRESLIPWRYPYVVCLDCGKEFPYQWQQMRIIVRQPQTSRPARSMFF
jgi:hypothetical protein